MVRAAGDGGAGDELSGTQMPRYRPPSRSHQPPHPCRPQFSTYADLHRHQCGTGSILLQVPSLLLSSSIYLWGTPRGPIPLPDRSPPVRPGFRLPDSGSSCQATPRSPRWLIGLPSARKPSPAKGFSKPVRLPACPPRWLPIGRTRGCHCAGRWLRGSKQSPVNGTFGGMSRPRGLVPPAAPSFGLLT
jgi:hypothetical protein